MQKVTVVYDDGCPTCTVGKNMAERLDHAHAITFVGMNTDAGKALVQQHQLDMDSSAYAISERETLSKAAMVKSVLSHNGFVGMLLSLPFRIPWLGDKLYDVLVLHRNHVTTSTVK